MQIVIYIDEDMYEYIKGLNNEFTDYRTTLALYDAVRNGISLPKGHGRLIDEKDMLHRLEAWNNLDDKWDTAHYLFTRTRILEAPTIIEADKEVEGNADSD